MLCPVPTGKHGAFSRRVVHLFNLTLMLLLLAATPAWSQTVASWGFEDGTADGWTSFNGASTPVATTLRHIPGRTVC